MAHGCFPWAPSSRPANHRLALPASRRALCARAGTVRPARHVGGDVGRPHAVLWAMPGQATQAAHTVRVGRPRGFRPMDSFLNRNHFLFYFEFISNSNFENSYLDIQSFKNYEISFVGFVIL
jgi:hypothetical protein